MCADNKSATTRSLVISGAVYLGAVILIGIPATVVLHWIFASALEAVGLGALLDLWAVGLLVLLFALILGLQIAYEAAAVQLGGIGALGRGSRRVALVRYIGVTVTTLLVLVGVIWIGLSTAVVESGSVPLLLGLLVAAAGALVIYRSATAFVDGYR